MINKYSEIRDRLALYNACKGILRVKTAKFEKRAFDPDYLDYVFSGKYNRRSSLVDSKTDYEEYKRSNPDLYPRPSLAEDNLMRSLVAGKRKSDFNNVPIDNTYIKDLPD